MIGPKEKKERALGEHLNLKGERCQSPKCALVRKPYRPGAHGKSRRRTTLSDFGRQLNEKQKFKIIYGLDERNLRNIFEKAQKTPGSSALRLLELAERRLDNVIYRLGLAKSRITGRQLVVQGHIMVNDMRVRSPGFVVKVNDIVSIRKESISKGHFQNIREYLKNYEVPVWLSLDKEKLEGKMVSIPQESNLPVEINLLIESFNK